MLVLILKLFLYTDLGTPLVFKLQEAKSSDAESYHFLTGKQPQRLIILVTQLLKDVHSPIMRAIKVFRAFVNQMYSA